MSAWVPCSSACRADTAKPLQSKQEATFLPRSLRQLSSVSVAPTFDYCFLPDDIPNRPLLLLSPEQKSLRGFVARIMGCQNSAACNPVSKNGPFHLSLEDSQELRESL